MKKNFLKLSVVCVAAIGLASSLSAKALSDAEVANLIKGNTMLNNQTISVKKVASQTLSHFNDGSIAKSFKSTLVAKIVESLSHDKILPLLLGSTTCEIC